MNLEDIYSSHIQQKNRNVLYSGRYAPEITRDPFIQNLELSVSRQLDALATVSREDIKDIPSSLEIQHVSVTDAIKELIDLQSAKTTL